MKKKRQLRVILSAKSGKRMKCTLKFRTSHREDLQPAQGKINRGGRKKSDGRGSSCGGRSYPPCTRESVHSKVLMKKELHPAQTMGKRETAVGWAVPTREGDWNAKERFKQIGRAVVNGGNQS